MKDQKRNQEENQLKSHIFSREELRQIKGGEDDPYGYGTGRCFGTYDDRICWYMGPSGVEVNGECGSSDNGSQCRCIAFDRSSSVPDSSCVR
ncbi:hypothetical protein D7004_04820 [Pedobacter jejuensis]|uniref:Uncharacterized protein n=1 Tax=Pedobacter jejuensis TaxID=1268550 RepID=A0A3N0BZR5_9SPHI|nr:hypothetical protein D7004_04820 [Pedobacter jejuensis]